MQQAQAEQYGTMSACAQPSSSGSLLQKQTRPVAPQHWHQKQQDQESEQLQDSQLLLQGASQSGQGLVDHPHRPSGAEAVPGAEDEGAADGEGVEW